MKILLLSMTFIFAIAPIFAEQLPNHMLWDALLKKHVKKNGVDYDSFKKDKKELDDYLKQFEAISLTDFNDKEQLALFINAYNGFTIQLILQHYTSNLKSIKDIKNPWNNKIYNIAGVKYSLDEIEHKFLREKLKEPRIHFAINCASVSCPPLQPFAFLPDKIEEQLTEVTVKFINSSEGVKFLNNEIAISQLFDWFKKDFETDKTTVKDYIAGYLKPSKDISKFKVSFISYNWTLNKAEI